MQCFVVFAPPFSFEIQTCLASTNPMKVSHHGRELCCFLLHCLFDILHKSLSAALGGRSLRCGIHGLSEYRPSLRRGEGEEEARPHCLVRAKVQGRKAECNCRLFHEAPIRLHAILLSQPMRVVVHLHFCYFELGPALLTVRPKLG